jgi:hypothetical protein
MCNIPVNANSLTNPGFSNLRIGTDIVITGAVKTRGYVDTGATMYATFRPASMLSFAPEQPQVHGGSFQYDWTGADMSAMDGMPLAVARSNIINVGTGVVTVPVSGLYNLFMQGSFSNSGVANPVNGVYYYFQNQAFAGSRRAAVFSSGPLVSTNTTQYLLAGERIQPMFYSSDSGAKLLANGESYLGFNVLTTVTPTHSNYFRV